MEQLRPYKVSQGVIKEYYPMKLGIFVNTDRHAEDIAGLTKAAVSKGHEVIIFIMDTGANLLSNSSVTGLSSKTGVRMNYCDHNAGKMGISKKESKMKILHILNDGQTELSKTVIEAQSKDHEVKVIELYKKKVPYETI